MPVLNTILDSVVDTVRYLIVFLYLNKTQLRIILLIKCSTVTKTI